jgi:putative colanic acid biosynthesis UDP-glucose lipid carrier transferase
LVISALLFLEGLVLSRASTTVFAPETRVSRGKKFTIFKFRITCKNEQALTPVGKVIKQVYLDELPQLFNVLIGDMSMVGPRPHVVWHYERDLREGIISAKYITAGLLGLIQGSKGHEDLRKEFEELTPSEHPNANWATHISNHYFQMYREASDWELMKYDLWIIYLGLRVVLEAKGI